MALLAFGATFPLRRAERRLAVATATPRYVACPNCRLRFSSAAAAQLVACPECGRAPQSIADAESLVGFRLVTVEDLPRTLPEALAVSLPVPDLGGERS
jgi:ribosomal protein L32